MNLMVLQDAINDLCPNILCKFFPNILNKIKYSLNNEKHIDFQAMVSALFL